MNLWPFKKRQVMTQEEWLASKPMPPCGHKELHYHWEHTVGSFPCPKCTAIREQRAKEEKENRLADKIAERVVKLLLERKDGQA